MDSVSRYLVGPTVDCMMQTTAKPQVGCPIRRSLDQSPFPAPQCLSQGITSFIASCCQGIHQTPFSRLIRSRDGQVSSSAPFVRRHSPSSRKPQPTRSSRKSYIFPPHARVRTWNIRLVYLTWNKTARGARIPAPPRSRPHSGEPNGSDVSLSSQCHTSSRSDETTRHARSLIRSHRTNSQWWSLSGSNR